MSNLKLCERENIEFYLRCKQGVREIARLIRRDHSVVSREIRRNGGVSGYDALRAQRAADKRVGHNRTTKLEKNARLKTYVIEKLKADWSPEQIAGRLKEAPPGKLKGKSISHETIYHYIYEGPGRYETLYPHLRRGNKRRQKRYARRIKKATIPLRTSIHERPTVVDEKQRYGDWESYTVIFRKQRDVLSVQFERKSKIVRMRRLPDKTAKETKYALINTVESMPKDWLKTMTFDNGGEGACHAVLRDDHGMETYFCDPFASWQKGGVENANGLIRQYLPRNTNLQLLTHRDIYDIQEKLNNRPRKSLNYQTPNEVLKANGG